MSIEFILYCINFIVNLKNLLELLSLISFFAAVSCYVIWFVEEKDDYSKREDKKFLLRANKAFILFIIIIIPVCFFPSEKTMYMMVGAKYLKNSDIPVKVNNLINQKLDEFLEDKK